MSKPPQVVAHRLHALCQRAEQVRAAYVKAHQVDRHVRAVGEPLPPGRSTDVSDPTGQTAMFAAMAMDEAVASINLAHDLLHDAEKSLERLVQSRAGTLACDNCGRARATHRGRCEACDRYLRRHGVERPRELWRGAS